MCPPLLAALAMGAVAVGSGIKSYAAGQAANQRAAGYDRQAGEFDRQAGLEQEKADWEVGRTRDKVSRVIGGQRAAYGAAGLSGETPAAVAFDTLNESEKDIYAIRWGAKVRSDNYYSAAYNARIDASNVRSGKTLAQIAPIIEGIGQVASIGSGTAGTKLFGNVTKFGQSIYS